MIKLLMKSNESVISEEHLYTIMFGLQDILEIYKSNLKEYETKSYSELSGEEVHLKKWYENKIYDTNNLLNEIYTAIANLEE